MSCSGYFVYPIYLVIFISISSFGSLITSELDSSNKEIIERELENLQKQSKFKALKNVLFKSAKRNISIQMFKVFLDFQGYDIMSVNDQKESLIHCALEYEDKVTLLISLGLNINSQDRYGNTPLYCAVQKNLHKVLKILLDNNADPLICNNEKQLPLHIAVLQGNLEAVKLLIPLMKQVDIRDIYGNSPLDYALLTTTSYYKQEVIQELLKTGIDINPYTVPNCESQTYYLIHWALKHNKISLLYFILSNGYSEAIHKDNCEQTALHYVARYAFNDDTNLVRYLIKKGLDCNSQDNKGNTALHESVIYENKQVFEDLLQLPTINYTIKNYSNQTVLDLLKPQSRRYTSKQSVFALLFFDYLKNNLKNSALHMSVLNSKEEKIEKVTREESLRTNSYRYTPAMMAKEGGNYKLFEFLALAQHQKYDNKLSDIDIITLD